MCNGKCEKSICIVAMVAKILVIVGALNWGLIGIGMFFGANLNLVNLILGSVPVLETLVYILVGVSAVMHAIGCKCKTCMAGCECCSSKEQSESSMM